MTVGKLFDDARSVLKGLVFAAALLASIAAAALTDPVQVESGQISGQPAGDDGEVWAYKGIPFAAPPVGNLRWKPPQAPLAWEGVRACDAFGPSCPQRRRRSERARKNSNEDCLSLNIWTAAESGDERLPVMVWIHGGGFTSGSGSVPTYNGAALAREGVVLVTINYRLGPFGFFAHPLLSKESEHNASGNYGILDQIAALKWVRQNIAAFGGDPGNVTIFGESAGGTSIYLLCATPLSKGLFHRAISQSAWVSEAAIAPLRTPAHTRESVEATGLRMGEALLTEPADDVLAALRAASPDALLEKASEGFRFPAAVDAWVFPEAPASIFAKGRQNDVPLIAGSNADEGTMFAGRKPFDSLDAYREAREEIYGVFADEMVSMYSAEDVDAIRASVVKYITDRWFVQPARAMVRGMEQVPSKAYLYHFTRVSSSRPAMGAFHSAEIPYAFKNLRGEPSAIDRGLSDTISAYWIQFAKTGDPNAAGLPDWPAYESASDSHLELGDRVQVGVGLRKEACDLLDRIEAAWAKEGARTDRDSP